MNSKDCEPHWWCDAALLINFIIYDYCKLCNIHFCIFFFFLHGTWKFRAFSLLPEYNFLLWQIKGTEKQQAGRSSIIFFKKSYFVLKQHRLYQRLCQYLMSPLTIDCWFVLSYFYHLSCDSIVTRQFTNLVARVCSEIELFLCLFCCKNMVEMRAYLSLLILSISNRALVSWR